MAISTLVCLLRPQPRQLPPKATHLSRSTIHQRTGSNGASSWGEFIFFGAEAKLAISLSCRIDFFSHT